MSDIQLWKSNSEVIISNPDDFSSIVNVAKQLRPTDQKQLVSAFESGNFQMLSTYVWSKSITALKSQLAKMGAAFIGEMLDRPDISESSNLQQVITDFEAIQLSENLGLINSKSAFRLKSSMDLLTFFSNPDFEDDGHTDDDFSKLDALQVVKACVQGVLGQDKIDLRIDFKEFRDSLEFGILTLESNNIQKLIQSPPFFKRATVKILLSIIKSKSGAQLENALANTNLILPEIWSDIRQPEKWQVGRSYAELFSEGKTTAVSGLKQALLKVKGFDYVPEDLRSSSFMKAASEIIKAHEGINNFYYEAAPTRTLKDMGSVIPMPAFSICMSAVLSVKLGNFYGRSWEAQAPANSILSNVTKEKWVYYFDECFPNDERVLYKLSKSKPRTFWIDLINENEEMENIKTLVKNRTVKNLIDASIQKTISKFEISLNNIRAEAGFNA